MVRCQEDRGGDQRDRQQAMSSDGPRKTSSSTLLELETIGGFEGKDSLTYLVSGAAVLKMHRARTRGESRGISSEEANAVIWAGDKGLAKKMVRRGQIFYIC